jgi:hypothetical protein
MKARRYADRLPPCHRLDSVEDHYDDNSARGYFVASDTQIPQKSLAETQLEPIDRLAGSPSALPSSRNGEAKAEETPGHLNERNVV